MILGLENESSLEEKLIVMVGPPSEQKLRGWSFFFLGEIVFNLGRVEE
jgi:hypothetical protein